MADRMAVMEAGHLAQVGTPEEIYRHPSSRMVAEFIGETNILEGRFIRESSRENFYDVETPCGVLRGRLHTSDWVPTAGQPVILSIRPESLTFHHVIDSPNRLPGRIIDTTYLGSTAQYQLQMQNGTVLKVCEMNPYAVRTPSDEDVRVMAPMFDVVIIRK